MKQQNLGHFIKQFRVYFCLKIALFCNFVQLQASEQTFMDFFILGNVSKLQLVLLFSQPNLTYGPLKSPSTATGMIDW